MKKEGGFETLLFGPERGPRESRRNSTVMSGKGKVQIDPDKVTANMSRKETVEGDATTVVSKVVRDTGLSKKTEFEKSVQSTRSATDNFPSVSMKNQSSDSNCNSDSTRGIMDADADGVGDTVIINSKSASAVTDPFVTHLSDTIENRSNDHISLSDSGPFREKRRGVHFSETLGDGDWENICIDTTPFTIVPSEEGYGFAQGLDQKSTLDDGTMNLTIPTESKASTKEGDAISRTESAKAEQVFCEQMSSSLFSSNSPLESESDKVNERSQHE